MGQEDAGQPDAALKCFLQAWNEATNDFEKFLAAYYIARRQTIVADKLHWLETALQFGTKVNDVAVQSAFPALYKHLAECYTSLGNVEQVKAYTDLAMATQSHPTDSGPFYHGTKADLHIGDLLMAGGQSNYKADLVMNHIYFTAMANGAGLAASLAKGDGPERVYIVEPTGSFEHDPNVTDKKFPGNPTRSYRSQAPLKIVGEITDWVRPNPEALQQWRERLAAHTGKIIN